MNDNDGMDLYMFTIFLIVLVVMVSTVIGIS